MTSILMEPEIKIHDMKAGDLLAVLDFWVQAWAPVVPGIDFEARRPNFVQHLAELAKGGARQRIAVVEGRPVGLLVIHPETGYLDQIVVAPACFGGGLAKALLDDARKIAAATITLTVNQINTRAIRFYEREGFVRGESGISPTSGLLTWHYAWSPN